MKRRENDLGLLNLSLEKDALRNRSTEEIKPQQPYLDAAQDSKLSREEQLKVDELEYKKQR